MKIGIRTEANKAIATGHVMRCLAIADELKKLGEKPVFILADDSTQLLIEQQGYEYFSLDSDWKHMESEIDKLQKIIEKYEMKVLLIDSYYVTKSYLEKLHSKIKIVYIDDIGEDTYDVDTIICYANYYKKLDLCKRYSLQVRLLQGTDYVPLRNEFSDPPKKEISAEIKNIIVMSGGTDRYDFLHDFSQKIVESSLHKKLESINIICGKYYDQYDRLIKKFGKVSGFCFHKAVDNIGYYMLSADVAISAAGVTSYELCAMGVPSIIYTIADNQVENAKSFYKDGIMEYVGDVRTESVIDKIIGLLQNQYQDYTYRKMVSEGMKRKVDGKGAQRIARHIYELAQ